MYRLSKRPKTAKEPEQQVPEEQTKTPEKESQDEQEEEEYQETIENLYQPASALARRGGNQFSDRIEELRPTKESVAKLYPVSKDHLSQTEEQAIAEWNNETQRRKDVLNNNPTYQFAFLVAAAASKTSVDSLIQERPSWPGPIPGDMTMKKAVSALKSVSSHGELDFTPEFGGNIQFSYDDLCAWVRNAEKVQNKPQDLKRSRGMALYKGKFGRNTFSSKNHVEIPKLEEILYFEEEELRVSLRNYFARLVAENMKEARTTSNVEYQLNANYNRIMTKRHMLLVEIMKILKELN